MTSSYKHYTMSMDDTFIRKNELPDFVNYLWSCGMNTHGNLGINNTISQSSPVQVINPDIDWSDVSAGASHSMAIKTNNTIWIWGNNEYGQLGDNTIINKSSPVQIIATETVWRKIFAGYFHSLAIDNENRLWMWGWNLYGQLGDNTSINRSSPVQTISGGNIWNKIAAGNNHSIAIKTDGTLWLWGVNNIGQLATNDVLTRSSPTQTISLGNNWSEASGGINHTVAIKTDGTLWTWGDNTYGQLGINSLSHRSSPVQTVGGGTNWSKVAAGGYHTAGIKTDGTLWLWGANGNGQVGINSTSGVLSPTQTILGGNDWMFIELGDHHSSAIKTNSTLWTWGRGLDGQLGNGAPISKSSPIQTIIGGSKWLKTSLGSFFSLFMHGS